MKRPRGQTTANVLARMSSSRPFEWTFLGNLERKLACGALRPDVAKLVEREIERRKAGLAPSEDSSSRDTRKRFSNECLNQTGDLSSLVTG